MTHPVCVRSESFAGQQSIAQIPKLLSLFFFKNCFLCVPMQNMQYAPYLKTDEHTLVNLYVLSNFAS